jgi:hypothetical protein
MQVPQMALADEQSVRLSTGEAVELSTLEHVSSGPPRARSLPHGSAQRLAEPGLAAYNPLQAMTNGEPIAGRPCLESVTALG